MVLVIDERGERHSKFAAAHVGLEIFAGEEDAQIIAGSDPGYGRVMARIGVRAKLRRKNRVEHDFRFRRQNEIIFVEDEGEKSLEGVGRKSRPEKCKGDADALFHAVPWTRSSAKRSAHSSI